MRTSNVMNITLRRLHRLSRQDLGWSYNGRYIEKAEECLTRLQATAMQFISDRIGQLDSVS
ncbi:plasmid replication initiator TrfA, partial [Escherichia coli]